MKLVRYAVGAGPVYGEVDGEKVWELTGSIFEAPRRTGTALPLSAVTILQPVMPTKFLLVSLNYQEVITQLGYPRPPNPILFLKASSAIIPPGAGIRYPAQSKRVTIEPELVLVIGRECRRVPEARALDHVLGYTITNDVSARDIQEAEGQYTRCKSFDTFGPLGPYIVTGVDASDLAIRGHRNGECVIATRTRNLIFGLAHLVHFASECMTLYPGDLIATGASGVAEVHVGDTVTCEIEGIGELTNPIVPWE